MSELQSSTVRKRRGNNAPFSSTTIPKNAGFDDASEFACFDAAARGDTAVGSGATSRPGRAADADEASGDASARPAEGPGKTPGAPSNRNHHAPPAASARTSNTRAADRRFTSQKPRFRPSWDGR